MQQSTVTSFLVDKSHTVVLYNLLYLICMGPISKRLERSLENLSKNDRTYEDLKKIYEEVTTR